MNKPLIIIGNPRSGTSIFRAILNTHPNLYIAPECGFAHFLSSNKYEFPVDIDLFSRDVYASKKFEFWDLAEEDISNFLKQNRVESYFEAISLVYKLKAKIVDKYNISYWGDKNNYYIKLIEEVDLVYKSPKILFIVRDGRDVACSYQAVMKSQNKTSYHPELSVGLQEIANEWSTNNNLAYDYLTKNVADRFLLIKYEDLISKTLHTLNEISCFLDIDNFSDKLLQKVINDEPSSFSSWKGEISSKLNTSKIGRYKLDLSNNDIILFNKIAGKTLERFNY